MSKRALLAGFALLAASSARAASFPTRGGETGLLDVPNAEVALPGGGLIGAEFGLAQSSGRPVDLGPLPLSLVTGLGRGLEIGFSMREGGRPGDPRPSPTLFAGALKYRLLEADGFTPALALDLNLDRINWKGIAGARAIASTARVGRVSLASYLGVEGHGPGLSLGPTVGLASSIALTQKTDTVLELAAGPRGAQVGGALRYAIDQRVGLSFGVDWLPHDSGLRFSVGVSFAAVRAPPRLKRAPPPTPAVAKVASGPALPVFADDRPHFRLVMPSVAPSTDRGPRHLQYGPWLDQHRPLLLASVPATAPAAPLVKRGGGSSIDGETRVLERHQGALDDLERRIATATLAAKSRDELLAAEAKRLALAEKELLARAAEVLTLEQAAGPLAAASEHERQLLVTLQRLRTQEGELESAEQAAAYAGEAARQRAAQAAIREERAGDAAKELEQKLASVEPGPRRNVARRELFDVRESRLLATQERLAATQDRHDSLERTFKAKGQRLGSLEKRIGLAGELLALRYEVKRPAAPVAETASTAAKAGATSRAALTKASLTPPLPAAPPATAAEATTAPALAAVAAEQSPASWSGEKQMVAAGLISLQRPDQPLDDLDRQTLAGIARQVAGTSYTMITVVARARTDELLPAAATRGEEVKAALAAAGPFPASRIEVRTVVHPRETSVGLLVSAFRFPAQSAPTPARPEPRSTP